MSLTKHILIVDDNYINRQYFSMSLKKSGHKTTVVESGFEAISMVKNNLFDMILMDIRMSEMDGYETTNHIRELPHYNHIPILAVSAEPLSQHYQSAFDGFLLKPASPKQLATAVENYCAIKKSHLMFNHNKALKYAYDDEKILSHLMQLFIDDLPIQLSSLNNSIQKNEHKSCQDIIHKLKGSCQTCGADLLDQHLDKLTLAINDNDQSTIEEQSEVVKSFAYEFISAMKQHLSNQTD